MGVQNKIKYKIMEKKILYYLSELETSGDTSYQRLLKYADIAFLQHWIEKRNSFFDTEILLPDKGYLGILNIHSNANFIYENKFDEIKELMNYFSEDYFYFLTDFLTVNELKGVVLKFPKDIKWEEFSNNQVFFGEGFFSTGIPNYFWLGENWVRQVMAYDSDIYIPEYKKTIDFPCELIVVKEENFEAMSKIYESKYGAITPILQHKEFFEKIFESEFSYLLSENIYVTSNSIDYINKQL